MYIPGNVIVDRKAVRQALFPTEHGPIIRSRMQNDFYKSTMAAFFHRYYPEVLVGYQFFNRTKKIRLADEINPDDVRRELEFASRLRYGKKELRYLGNVRNDGALMFSDAYLDALEESRLPNYHLDVRDGQFEFKAEGVWHDTCDWEIYALAIISALRTEALMKKKTAAEQDAIVEYTAKQIEQKILTLREHRNVRFSDFGTRRAASPMLQCLIDEMMLTYLPRGQFVGTSNTLFAQELDTMPIGTNAHELPMVIAALADGNEELREAPIKALHQWWEMYGWSLSIILPDTFGSNWMFKNLTAEFALKWKGMRPDSMDLNEFAEKQIGFYKRHGQDSRERMMIPSDGLSLDTMIAATYKWQDQIRVGSGWGTLLTNDTGLGHPSIVVKAVTAQRPGGTLRHCVKLGDNLAKGIGEPGEKARYVDVFDYHTVYNQACIC